MNSARFRHAVRQPLWSLLCLGLVAWLLSLPWSARADVAAAFAEANLLYEQGHPDRAAEAYHRLWTNGVSSVALHFNLGNAWLKAGQPGRAIHHFRLAERLAPRDPDVRTNLELARAMVRGGSAVVPSRLAEWTGALSLNEWTWLAVGGLWLWMVLLILRLLQPAWNGRLRLPARLAAVLCLGTSVLLVLAWKQRPAMEAVVVDDDVTLRHGPREQAPPVQSLAAGLELVVIDHQGNWVQVRGAERGIGWLPAEHVALLSR